MRVAVFSTKDYDRAFLEDANEASGSRHDFVFLEGRLDSRNAILAAGAVAVCIFCNDIADRAALSRLAEQGTRLIALRAAGYNNVDLAAAAELGLSVARVPAYSPEAVAEHAVALMLSLNRKIHRSYARVREGNFELEGLLGFDMRGRRVGIVGTGRIGLALARILKGFGCELAGADPEPAPGFEQLGGRYVPFSRLLATSDIISLHCPLTPQTAHLIDEAAVAAMKPGVMLINTSRGGVVDTRSVIAGLKRGRIGYLGLDVYEEEGDLFYEDLSGRVLQDDVFARLLTFPNVLITGHQGFFTREALTAIATTTVGNLTAFEQDGAPLHPVTLERVARPASAPRPEATARSS